jgi:hypothetical protein
MDAAGLDLAEKGPLSQAVFGSTGIVSTWSFNRMDRPPPLPRMMATTFGRHANGVHRMEGRTRGEVELEDVDFQSHRARPRRQIVLNRSFRSGDTLDSDDISRQTPDPKARIGGAAMKPSEAPPNKKQSCGHAARGMISGSEVWQRDAWFEADLCADGAVA